MDALPTAQAKFVAVSDVAVDKFVIVQFGSLWIASL